MEKPNGALIKTDDPCEDCGGRHKVACTKNRKSRYSLRAYQGRRVCEKCCKEYGVL